MEKQKKGAVKEAKRMLEDRIREKREQKLAEVRKPLINTPNRKRTRQEGAD